MLPEHVMEVSSMHNSGLKRILLQKTEMGSFQSQILGMHRRFRHKTTKQLI